MNSVIVNGYYKFRQKIVEVVGCASSGKILYRLAGGWTIRGIGIDIFARGAVFRERKRKK